MSRLVVSLLFFLSATTAALAQVQVFGDLSFSVPDGWRYQQKPGADFAGMVLTEEKNFWVMAVYTPMPSSGDAAEDLKRAWQRIVLAGPDYQGLPALPYYDINHSVGYPGKRADDSAVNRATYTRLYVLEAEKSFIPVAAVSNDGMVLNAKEHIANAFIGSIRLAPLKAAPVRTTITLADLVGRWRSGAAVSINFYNRTTGRYESSSDSFYGAGYTIAADGTFAYKMSGMMNNRITGDDDSGAVALDKDFIIFKGHNHEVRYRFLNCQQALDGSTVLTLLPPGDLSRVSIIRDSEYYSRAPQESSGKK
jgi:hypothetical protein